MDLKTQLRSRISSHIDGFGLNTAEIPDFLERNGEDAIHFLDFFYLKKDVYKDVIFRTYPRHLAPSWLQDEPLKVIRHDEDF